MPIKPENRARYPKDWAAISLAAKERAGWRCAHCDADGNRCAAEQYAVGVWQGDVFLPVAHRGTTYSQARQNAADAHFTMYGDEASERKIVVIVLTVAHLDHQPENCDPANLAAMCQRHHLAYDHDHHRANAQATRRAKAGTLELF